MSRELNDASSTSFLSALWSRLYLIGADQGKLEYPNLSDAVES
jgi:hypothetical protein